MAQGRCIPCTTGTADAQPARCPDGPKLTRLRGRRDARRGLLDEGLDNLAKLVAQILVGEVALAIEVPVRVPERDLSLHHASARCAEDLPKLALRPDGAEGAGAA